MELTPVDYKKWVAPSVKYGCKLGGVMVAWTLQVTISAFHSSVGRCSLTLSNPL